jgi:DNA-binding NarL/FixJ family response regulator
MTEPSSEKASAIRVLLVEDHALTRMGLKVALERATDIVVVGEASNGEEAVERAESLKPDVILMDVGMPVMDGIQAAKAIVTAYPVSKIVMLTQHDNDSDILASLAAGASGYCLKDVKPERLYMAIRSVNAGDAWLDATIAGRILRHYGSTSEPAKPEQSAAPTAEPAVQNLPKTAQSFDRPAPEPLSPRELEVLKLIVEGLSNQAIADNLIISLATAKSHVRNILNKLAVDDRTQAAVHAMRRGLV